MENKEKENSAKPKRLHAATCSGSSCSRESEDEEAKLIGEADIETLKTLITKQSVRKMVRRMEKKEKSAKRKHLHAATAVAAAAARVRVRRPNL
jgi:hypothetical protein